METRRQSAITRFITERVGEGADRYEEALQRSLHDVRDLFAATDDLLSLRSGTAFATQPDLLTPARYLGGPPISEDDLNVLSEGNVAGRRRLPVGMAEKAATIISAALDRARFPWMFADPLRSPTEQERTVAIHWTAGLWAAQRVATARRSESSARQEQTVKDLLLQSGVSDNLGRPVINRTASDLEPGYFCGETRVLGINCDVPVKLFDNRLLLIECKASNSSLNSVKRLIRETGGQAVHWTTGFGERAITAAVLSGVYHLRHLMQAQQDYRITIFWEQDLAPLRDFVQSATRVTSR